ncbi:recombinase family protein [uncultured Vibrio sp.]|uniref:recombinase family protein n=1 Tax=uncultured Vibrio sp. TaxID=114054 RepID=UPI00262F052C|nr:recombinase family protein [uncultured Vibrio sp.]
MEQRTAYIYSRVSKLIQATDGGGISRQIDKATSFINNLNSQSNSTTYTIADNLIIDKGLSAYYGFNTKDNAGLGAFIKAVEDGRIPPKSLLVVEAVDRISRLPPTKARKVFERLSDLQIDVAIIKFGLVIRHDQKMEDMGTDLLLTAAFHLAHLESEQKSQRIRATFDKKRKEEKEGGEKRTSVCPAWLKLSEDKKSFELIPEAAETLKLIFKLKISGKGSHAICNLLNEDGIPRIAKKQTHQPWSKRVVEKYLKMEQSYGAFMPTEHVVDEQGKRIRKPRYDQPLENYYPPVVDKETWIQAQQAFKAGRTTRGRVAKKAANLFAWLCKCPSCGGSMTYYKPNRGSIRLRCRNQVDNNYCSQKSINYEEMEKLLVSKLSGLDYNQLIGESFEKLQRDIDLLQNQIDEEESALKELSENLMVAPASAISRISQIIGDRTNNVEELKIKQREKLQVKFEYAEKTMEGLELENEEDRERYNKFLRQYIDYILCGDSKINVVKVKLKQVDKVLPFYFTENENPFKWARHDKSESIVESLYTHGKDINEVRLPVSFGGISGYHHRLREIDTVEPPLNENDDLQCLKYQHSVFREISVNYDKWKEIIEIWNLEDEATERREEETELRYENGEF